MNFLITATKPPIGIAAAATLYPAKNPSYPLADVIDGTVTDELVKRWNHHNRLVAALQAVKDAEAYCQTCSKENYNIAVQCRIDAMLGIDNLLAELAP